MVYMISNLNRASLAFLCTSLVLLVGCTEEEPPADQEVNLFETDRETRFEGEIPAGITFRVSFTLNTHGWVLHEDMRAVVREIVDLHEAEQVPLDTFMIDPVLQRIVADEPTLMARIASSDYVSLSLFWREPTPYYSNFDLAWMTAANSAPTSAQQQRIDNYESHRLDVTTGAWLDEPGGFALLADLYGRPPVGIGKIGENDSFDQHRLTYYRAGGALFVADQGSEPHGFPEERDDTGLYWRPQHAPVRLWELTDQSASSILQTAKTEGYQALCDQLGSCPQIGTVFINIKMHDDNFYASDSSYSHIYYYEELVEGEDGEEDEVQKIPRTPPFPVDSAAAAVPLLTPTERRARLDLWADLVRRVASDPGLHGLNQAGLAEELAAQLADR